MEGFLDLRLPVWMRRMVTRGLAIIPAVIVVGASGDAGATRLLILSQVVLSLQLPFAVVPLVMFTGSRAIMGPLASPAWLRALAWGITAVIIALNVTLLWGML
jgi:manganese transport protein